MGQVADGLFAIFVLIISILNLVYTSIALYDANKAGSSGSNFIKSYSVWYILISLVGIIYAGFEAKHFFQAPSTVI
jgi:hypothetical protein